MRFIQLVFYVIVGYFIVSVIRRLMRGGSPRREAAARRQQSSGRRSSQMIRCEACGTFVTEGSALIVGDTGFCSKGCAEARIHRA